MLRHERRRVQRRCGVSLTTRPPAAASSPVGGRTEARRGDGAYGELRRRQRRAAAASRRRRPWSLPSRRRGRGGAVRHGGVDMCVGPPTAEGSRREWRLPWRAPRSASAMPIATRPPCPPSSPRARLASTAAGGASATPAAAAAARLRSWVRSTVGASVAPGRLRRAAPSLADTGRATPGRRSAAERSHGAAAAGARAAQLLRRFAFFPGVDARLAQDHRDACRRVRAPAAQQDRRTAR